jgi:type I restriction enzyme M protein
VISATVVTKISRAPSIAGSPAASSSSSISIWRRQSRTAKRRLRRDALGKLLALIEPFADKRENDPLAEPWSELTGAQATLTEDIEAFGNDAVAQTIAWEGASRVNGNLNVTRLGLHPLADRCRDLTKQIDLVAKLAGRVIDIAVKELDARNSDAWDNGDVNKARKALEAARAYAVEGLRLARADT